MQQMLEDYVRDLRKALTERRDAETSALVATSGNDRHDLCRGRIQGLTAAIDTVDDLVREYRTEVD